VQVLARSPRRHRIAIARILVTPLLDDRDRHHVARTRSIFHAMSLVPVVERWVHSHWWWRRALAVRVLGVLQLKSHAALVVAALDDDSAEVRAAALDSIADLRDSRTLGAAVVRLNDESLHHGRRIAVIAAFGPEIEPLVLELGEVDAANRLNYAQALQVCGTAQSLPTLARWTQDPDPHVRAASLGALGHVGLDARSAPLALDALEADDVSVRAMAAYALQHRTGPGDAAAHLAQHLDDRWPVAVQAAHSLKTMPDGGIAALQAAASRPDLAGRLARQTLWDTTARC
jgi:HEAT repeat protein